jgi:hypothetical protein
MKKQVLSVARGVRVPLSSSFAKQQVKQQMLAQLREHGWSAEVRLHPQRRISLTSVKERVGLCLQTGNMARFYADLLKLQLQFAGGKIDSAVYILPTKDAARQIGSNIANFERFTAELRIFEPVITIPILVIGIQ